MLLGIKFSKGIQAIHGVIVRYKPRRMLIRNTFRIAHKTLQEKYIQDEVTLSTLPATEQKHQQEE